MLKKMTMLASMVALVAAFVVPPSASADRWADGGVALSAGQAIEQPYEGFLQFNTGATGAFGCEVTAMVKTNGPTAAQIVSFNPTTTTCVGTVAFKGCKLIKDTASVPFDINNEKTPLVVTKAGGNITIHNEYEAGSCAGKQTSSLLEFAKIEVAVEGTNPITKLTISGKSTAGVPVEGSLTPEGTPTLGILPDLPAGDSWADGGIALSPGEVIEQPYEGFLQFNTGVTGTFGCEVTAMVKTTGPKTAEITSYSPTTSTCVGTVAFKGCKLIKDTSNVPWDINNTATPLVVTKAGGNITIQREYEAGSCARKQTSSLLEFAKTDIAVEGTNPISKLTISGKSTTGLPIEGSLIPEGTATLGIL